MGMADRIREGFCDRNLALHPVVWGDRFLGNSLKPIYNSRQLIEIGINVDMVGFLHRIAHS